nr:MAG TPA: Protein of unknown function (DUF2829) [Caudoviricetes sp.]
MNTSSEKRRLQGREHRKRPGAGRTATNEITPAGEKERNFTMKKYIGTKLIEAAPAIRKGGKVYEKTQPIPRSMEREEDGYKVRYPDGYESFSPKQVFEEAYRPTDGLSFGLAIEAAKKGMKIARRGWNGKNQYVELAERISYENAAHEVINAKHEAIGNKALAFVGTSGVQLGWLASQADMLADDWMIVGEEVAE